MSVRKISACVGSVALVMSLLIAGAPAASGAGGSATVVPGLGGTETELRRVNDAGTAVGSSLTTDGSRHAIVWSATDGTTDLGTLDGYDTSEGDFINTSGQVLGYGFNTNTGAAQTLVWTKAGGLQNLGIDSPSYPVDENDAGVVLVGEQVGNGSTGWAGTPGHLVQVKAPDGSTDDVGVTAVNNQGDVVGDYQPSAKTTDAFLWSPGTDSSIDLGSLGGASTQPLDINDSDQVAGNSQLPDGTIRAYRWSADTGMVALSTPSELSSNTVDIDPSGAVLGQAYDDKTSTYDPVTWTSDGNRESLGDMKYPGVGLEGFADDGRVVGTSSDGDAGDQQGFVWSHDTGTVELPPTGGQPDSVGYGVSPNGRYAVGISDPNGYDDPRVGTEWNLDTLLADPSAPGAPRGVQAAAGDGSASVWWKAPLSEGGARVTSYTVAASPGNLSKTVSVDSGASDGEATVTGLTNGTAYTFTVKATNSVSTGDASPATSPAVTPQAGAPAPQTASGETTQSQGGTVSTGDQSTTEQPVTTSVTVPSGTQGGQVQIVQGTVNHTAPTGYSFAGQQVDITAPAASSGSPLQLVFTIDPSQAGGATASTLQLFRTENGGPAVQIPDCTATDGSATPDPCISSRETGTGGEIELTVLTSSASTWNFAVTSTAPPPPHYTFKGFYAPVANPPKVNAVKAGKVVSLSFSLGGNKGSSIIASGYPLSSAVSCSHPAQVLSRITATAGSLAYSTKTKRYSYSWRTAKGYANTCRGIEIKLNDNTRHYALFHFAK